MPTLNTKIWQALRRGIDTLDMRFGVWSTAWPVAFPGVDYPPVSGVPYLAIGDVQAAPIRALIDENISNRIGTLTVTAVMPVRASADPSVYKEAAGKIMAHFQGQLRYDDVCLRLMSNGGNTAYAAGGYRDSAWWREPVIIPWQTFK